MDVATDETISVLDPRRFTPTLHANLVSEILALRRDQEEKIRIIETLETTLHTTREEHGTYQEKNTATAKENRSLKRQLALLEGGTSSALGELARERDEAVDAITDTKKRLETAQRKLRNQEDDSQRMHDLWEQDKDAWERERRTFERKVHVAESRLKVVLDEVAAYQAAHAHGAANAHSPDSDVEESGKDNDAASVRTMSLTNSIRMSLVNPGNGKANGHSLADELNFDVDEDDQTDIDGRESAMSFHASPRHGRTMSRESVASRLHRRNLSIESSKRPGSSRGRLFMNPSVLEALEGEDEETKPAQTRSYTDTGVQFSPPPSPKLSPVVPPMPTLSSTEVALQAKPAEADSLVRADTEIEANQRRKRVQPSRPLTVESQVALRATVSVGSQTVQEPLSPPKSLSSPRHVSGSGQTAPKPSMVSNSTQTERPLTPTKEFMSLLPPPPIPMDIPSINVQPPTSRPTTPREPRLPQHFKHFGCQVNLISASVATSHASCQTEGIQTDKRLALLPPHLQPSAISSRPASPNVQPSADLDKAFTSAPNAVPPRNPRRLESRGASPENPASPPRERISEELHDAYPGNNDDGPLSESKAAPIKRPHRFSSLFAGFDTASSDEADEFGDADLSDSEYRTALSAPRPVSISSKQGQRNSFGTAPTSPEEPPFKTPVVSSVKTIGTEVYSSYTLGDKESGVARTGTVRGSMAGLHSAMPLAGSSNRASVMRKAAMIQSGITSHQGRARSPSLPDAKNPPFPIPTRASSRKPTGIASAPSDGQRSPTRFEGFSGRAGQRSSYRPPSIRKVRSATALPRNHRYRRHGSRSPPPLSPSTEAPESPSLPPLPRNDLTTPRTRDRASSHYRRHRHELSTNTDNTNPTDPMSLAGASSQPSGVVDAIAQTMIGEWMYKYVRRRKSFSIEAQGKDDNSNDRHKRWVWLAPYERAILWSSKQPSSGSALMGKTGRKRKLPRLMRSGPFADAGPVVIQSVLDVKDDNPAPKGMAPIFNRSILILTPQRALKFTASSSERHYVWLTALSFLAHSQQAVPEIVAPVVMPPKAEPVLDFEPPQVKPKRSGIRDSIRLAKGRTVPVKAATPSIPSLPSAPSSQMGDVSSFRIAESGGTISTSHTRDISRDAAEPPLVPRFYDRNGPPPVHSRKRSNTGGHIPPPLSFRGFSGPVGYHNSTNSTAGNSVGTAGSSDIYQSQGSSAGANTWALSQTASQRTSEASSRPSNFFDAIGTVRMEAFISPLGQIDGAPDEQQELRYIARRRSKEMRRRRSRSRQRDSYSSRSRRTTDQYYGGSKTAGEEDYFRDDPFRGF